MGSTRSFLWLALAVVAVLACQEKLTAPADCPALCPGGYEIRDTILLPVQDGDSSYEGYLQPWQGTSLRVSNGLPASEDRGIIRFIARPDSFTLFDTLRPYTIDSVVLTFKVLARDTLVPGLKVFLYRLPSATDTLSTFAQVDPLLNPTTLIDSFAVADTSDTVTIHQVYQDTTLYKVDIPAADTGVMVLGLKIGASAPTGIRVGNAQTPGRLTTYITLPTVTDTLRDKQLIPLAPRFSTFVSENPPPLDPDVLTVGGAPSVRTLLRFDWPQAIKDSGQLIRATLELVPTAPMNGLPGDSAFLQARIILSDLGSKSPLSVSRVAEVPIPEGSTDTLRLELVSLLSAWQTLDIPHGLMFAVIPEISNFTRATLGSTRTPGLGPRLKLTYAVPFRFTRP